MPCGHDCIFIRDESIVVIVIPVGRGTLCLSNLMDVLGGGLPAIFAARTHALDGPVGCLLPGRSIHLCHPPTRLICSRAPPLSALHRCDCCAPDPSDLRLSRQQQVSRLSATVPRARHAQMPLGERCMCLTTLLLVCHRPNYGKRRRTLLPRFRRCPAAPSVRPPAATAGHAAPNAMSQRGPASCARRRWPSGRAP